MDFEKKVGLLKARVKPVAAKLDDECLEQSALNDLAYEGYAEAITDRDNLELELEEYEAKLGESLRTVYEEAGQKYTENTLKELKLSDPKRLDLKRRIIEAEYRVNIFKGLVSSYPQRAEMIKIISGRIDKGFFGNLVIKGDEEQAKNNIYEAVKKGMAEKRKVSK